MTSPWDKLGPLPPRSLSLIVACGRGGAIGVSGTLPWHEPEDLAHFRRITTGHALIIGRATWESIGRPLPKRTLIVVSSAALELPAGVIRVPSPEAGVEHALSLDPHPFVAGGAAIYESLLSRCHRVWLTEIDREVPEADRWFSPLSRRHWEVVAHWPGDDPHLQFSVLDRRVLQG